MSLSLITTLIYLLSCKICGLQYVGSTTNPFCYCWKKNNNKKAERGVEHMQADFFEHFASHGHNGFLEDCAAVTLIHKTDVADSRRREEYQRRVLKTVSLYGLNTVA